MARSVRKLDTSLKPYVENYPPLKAWLDKHEAFCQWQVPLGSKEEPSAFVECWQLGGRQAIVTVYSNRNGWEIYTPGNSHVVADTLEDAERRLGLS